MNEFKQQEIDLSLVKEKLIRYEEITHNATQRDKEVENMKKGKTQDKVRDSDFFWHSRREETEKGIEKIFKEIIAD